MRKETRVKVAYMKAMQSLRSARCASNPLGITFLRRGTLSHVVPMAGAANVRSALLRKLRHS